MKEVKKDVLLGHRLDINLVLTGIFIDIQIFKKNGDNVFSSVIRNFWS